jgi:hypothetical protein
MLSTAVLLTASMVVGQVEETSPIPKDLIEDMKSATGTWAVEITSGGKTQKGKAVIRLTPDGQCMIANVTVKSGGTKTSYNFLSGWDSSTGGFTDQGINSEGEVWTTRWSGLSSTVSEGEHVGTLGGKKTKAKVKMERKSPDEIVVTISERTKGEETMPDTTILYRRMPERKRVRKRTEN